MSASALLVAVVDDEESVRKALRRLLRSAGMQVETFSSGQEFLNSLTSHQPDCLLLDLHMPGLTGLDVQCRLAAAKTRLPTIIITGHDQPGVANEALSAGASAYLTKPADERVLLEAITRAVSSDTSKRNCKTKDQS